MSSFDESKFWDESEIILSEKSRNNDLKKKGKETLEASDNLSCLTCFLHIWFWWPFGMEN